MDILSRVTPAHICTVSGISCDDIDHVNDFLDSELCEVFVRRVPG